jgi:hypothetical protein
LEVEGETDVEALASNFVPLSYVYAARYGEGRAAVPVLKSQALYANFSHVAGVAAQDGSAAYSIDKLHILDVLIGQLVSIKSQPLAAAAAPAELSGGRVDALIQQYGAELHAAATAPALPYAPSASASIGAPGMLFSMAA